LNGNFEEGEVVSTKQIYLRAGYLICFGMILNQTMLYFGVINTYRRVYSASFSIVVFALSLVGFIVFAGADYLIHREDKKEKAKKKRTIRY
jgi:hypothetical protein